VFFVKKAVLISILMLTIVSSVLAGTLANYTTTIDALASGSVVAKEFIFLEDGTDTFEHNVKIAPAETVVWKFGVKNYDGTTVTETKMYYRLSFNVKAIPGKKEIKPLTVTVKDSGGKVIDSVEGVGKMTVNGYFPVSATEQSDDYSVEIYWPSNDETDIDYAGDGFGTMVNVAAVASQVPIGGGIPVPSDYAVYYETGVPWGVGGVWDPGSQSTIYSSYKYNFEVTITNNSDEVVKSWELEFLLNEKIEAYWDAVNDSAGLPAGQYRFLHPQYYNMDIEPGKSVSFGGRIESQDSEPSSLTNATLNGKDADVTCSFGTLS
jgi:hypothetical protein